MRSNYGVTSKMLEDVARVRGSSATSHPKRSVLLVEDNQDDERMALRVIRQETPEAEVTVVRDGQEALRWLGLAQDKASETHSRPVDLVILDLKLPKVSGLEVLRFIRSTSGSVCLPVVIFTSSDEASDISACYMSGANCYVRKHVSYERYKESLALLLRFWLLEVSLPAL